MRWLKTSALVLGVLLVISNAFWLYVVVDQAVSYSYLSDEYDRLSESHQYLGRLAAAAGKEFSQADILHLIRQADPEAFIVESEGEVVTNGIVFRFQNGTLSSIE